jgi:hypothetical protein
MAPRAAISIPVIPDPVLNAPTSITELIKGWEMVVANTKMSARGRLRAALDVALVTSEGQLAARGRKAAKGSVTTSSRAANR